MMNVDTSNNYVDLHKEENCHSKNNTDELDREQQIVLKNNKEAIIDFIIGNKDSMRVEDLKVHEPIYKCYREKGNCFYCNALTNISCKNCTNYNNEGWLCTNHWQKHAIENHNLQWIK